MKRYLLLLGLCALARADISSNSSYAMQTIPVSGGKCALEFHISWWSDDYPLNSAPGRLALFDGSGNLVADLVASHYRDSGVSVFAGGGAVEGIASNVLRFCPDGTPADGFVRGTWRLSLGAGTYTLQTWSYVTGDQYLSATGVSTDSFLLGVTETPAAPPPPPPPTMFGLTTGATGGGTVSAGGNYLAGTLAVVSASPDAGYEFAGWSGDAGGTDNPLTLTMYRDWNVQANFTSAGLSLSTGASGGGNVTPGGSYPYGTWVTVSAAPDPTHYFAGWTGDAGGAATSINVYMDRTKSVQAMFSPKAGQVISFAGPGDQPVGATPVLTASSTAGLPVVVNVVSGPATLSGNVLTVTGSGTVTLQALQGGDAVTLPAAPVTVTFNALAAAARVRVEAVARTILQDARTTPAVNYVLGNP